MCVYNKAMGSKLWQLIFFVLAMFCQGHVLAGLIWCDLACCGTLVISLAVVPTVLASLFFEDVIPKELYVGLEEENDLMSAFAAINYYIYVEANINFLKEFMSGTY